MNSNEADGDTDRALIRTQFAAADDVVTAAQLVITNLLDGRLDTAEARSSYTDPTTQTLLDVEKARVTTNVAAIALNTAKVTYDGAAQVATNVTNIAGKQDDMTDSNHTHLHLHSGGSFVGVGTSSPQYKLHIIDSGDPTVKIERAANNCVILNETHFMIIKPANTQFDFNSQGHLTDMVFKSNNLERLRLKGNGDIEMTGDMKLDGNVGFFNTTPVAQHSTNGLTGGSSGPALPSVLLGSTFTGNTGSTAYTISDVVKCLKDIGLLAQ